MCTRKHFIEPILVQTPIYHPQFQLADLHNRQSIPDFTKYPGITTNIIYNGRDFKLTSQNGQNILRDLFKDDLLSSWKHLAIIQRDSEDYRLKLEYFRNAIIPTASIAKQLTVWQYSY